MQEAENSGEGLSEGEMKKIILSKLTPETKQMIRDSQADQKVLGNWVEVRGLPETMGKMAVRELLHSISATGLKDITIRQGRWRVGFQDSEQSEFFCSMVDGKVKYKGTVLKVRPWSFSYGGEQICDQLEKCANLERQKSEDAQGFGGKVIAIGEKRCSVCIALGKEGRAETHTTADHRWTPSDLKTIQSKMDAKGNSPQKPPGRMEHEMLTSMEGERVKGSPKERTETGHQKITRSKAEIQAAQDGPMLVENLVENLAKRVERDKENPGIKMIPR